MFPERSSNHIYDTEMAFANHLALNTDRGDCQRRQGTGTGNSGGVDQDGTDHQHRLMKTLTLKDASLVQMVHLHDCCDCLDNNCDHN